MERLQEVLEEESRTSLSLEKKLKKTLMKIDLKNKIEKWRVSFMLFLFNIIG